LAVLPLQPHESGCGQPCPATARVSAKALDRKVADKVLTEILTPENIHQLLADWQHSLDRPDLDGALREINQRIASVKRALSNLLDAIEAGELRSTEAAARVRQRQAELSGLELERADLADRQHVARATISLQQFETVLKTMKAEIQSREIAVARRALRSFIEKVEVEGDNYQIAYHPEVLTGLVVVPPRRFELLYQA
jgi:hypothetical protein